VFRSEDGRGPAYFISVIVSEIVLGILASLIVLWFSRLREFRADRGGAKLAGRTNMIAALERSRSTTSRCLNSSQRSVLRTEKAHTDCGG